MHLRALLFALLLPAAGCLTGTQHCKDAPPPDTTACFEFSNLASGLQGLGLSASLATLCTVIDAETQAGSCPAEGRVGGCAGDEQEAYDYIEWSYDASEPINCGSDEVRVDANGDPLTADSNPSSVCSAANAPDPISVTFRNDSGGPVTVYWSDPSCDESEYHRMDAGATVGQDTFDGHAWVARAGTGDPLGGVVWEAVLDASDDSTTVVIE